MYLLGGFVLHIETTLSLMSYAATITMKLTPVRKALQNLQSRGVSSLFCQIETQCYSSFQKESGHNLTTDQS